MIFSGAWTANPGLVHAGEANEAQARGTGVPRSTQCCLSDLVRWPCLSSNQWRRLMVRQKTDGSRWFSTRSARSMPQMFTRWIKQNCTHATPEEFTEIDTCHVFFCRACSLSLSVLQQNSRNQSQMLALLVRTAPKCSSDGPTEGCLARRRCLLHQRVVNPLVWVHGEIPSPRRGEVGSKLFGGSGRPNQSQGVTAGDGLVVGGLIHTIRRANGRFVWNARV